MIAPGVQPEISKPASHLVPLAGIALLGATMVVWASLDVTPLRDLSLPAVELGPDLPAVAYVAHNSGLDAIVVQPAERGAFARPVAFFPAPFGLHARGTTAPDGSLAVVLHADSRTGQAFVSTVDMRTSTVRTLEAITVDYLTEIAWKPGESVIAATTSGAPSEAGLVTAAVSEINLITGDRKVIAVFESVFEAAVVGYTEAGLYTVAIDQSGSVLHLVSDGSKREVKQLSVGRTRSWRLEPGGARIAYLDILGAGAGRAVIARILLLATGEITSVPGNDDHVGIVWRFGAGLPDVGGPGGSLAIDGVDGDALVVPIAWNPHGTRLLAEVTEGGDGGAHTLEVLSTDSRLRLTEGGATPLGWVIDER